MKDGVAAVKAALESTYACMGLNCTNVYYSHTAYLCVFPMGCNGVGEYQTSDGVVYSGMAACNNARIKGAGPSSPRPAPEPTPGPRSGPTPLPTAGPFVADDATIRTAVAAWLSDATAAEATYGHISTWETGGVTDMSYLFCGWIHYTSMGCNTAAASFNEEIGA